MEPGDGGGHVARGELPPREPVDHHHEDEGQERQLQHEAAVLEARQPPESGEAEQVEAGGLIHERSGGARQFDRAGGARDGHLGATVVRSSPLTRVPAGVVTSAVTTQSPAIVKANPAAR